MVVVGGGASVEGKVVVPATVVVAVMLSRRGGGGGGRRPPAQVSDAFGGGDVDEKGEPRRGESVKGRAGSTSQQTLAQQPKS